MQGQEVMQGQEAMQGQALDLSYSVFLHTGGSYLLPMQHDQQGWLQLNCFLSQEGHRKADPPLFCGGKHAAEVSRHWGVEKV